MATELDEAALNDLARFLASVFGGELGSVAELVRPLVDA